MVAHRVNSEGKVEVQVQWHGEDEPLTWEPVSSLAVSAKVVLCQVRSRSGAEEPSRGCCSFCVPLVLLVCTVFE